ncbi:hypothetical protein CBR_g51668 [Chara braunii]|uniref:Uncharacterized protein n=1 Tax=Chara braunii TaxID=69332 RepID=A0A388M8X9_CHABU|nr:hypothetical protein CBR_g51668 [Chara braunii]|eukprot:GBG91010.1 hypothetical protein CBR_g51668 [Chara braunii]
MADVQRRLPLLVLAVVVFLIVVFLHVCLSWRPWKQHRKRASTKRAAGERPMVGMQARAGVGAGQGGRRPPTAEPPRRYDPSLYSHLESWEMPLPPSDEDPETEEVPTLPLASGSTHLLSQTVRACGSASNEGGEFTSLLHQGLGDDDDGGLYLRFGLCSDGAREASRTFIIDADPSPLGVQQSGSQHTEHSTLRGGASVTGGVGPSAVGRKHGSSAPSADRLTSTCPARNGVATGSLRIGGARPLMPKRTTPTQPDLRDDDACRPAVRPAPTVENITRGVSNMRAHSDGGDDDGGGGDDADERFREDVEAGDDDDDIPIRPLGKTGGRGRGRNRGDVRGRSVGRGGRGDVSDDGGKSATYRSPEEQMQRDFPLIRSHRQARLHRSPRSMSTRENTRGKKRDVVLDDNQGQRRGRRHAPKAKRVRSKDASTRVSLRGAQGWAAAAEGDYVEEFTTEEDQEEATTSAVRESGRQRSSDQSASKRMLTPPPEAQQQRARDTQTEKAAVVDLGGEDDEPLDRRRMRTRTTATPPRAVMARAAVNERPVSGRLSTTLSQPRQRNEGGNGGSVQRGGGGEVVADARAVGAEAAGAAGAGGSGNVAPVATAREEAEVVATVREEVRGEKKGDREGGEPGSSQVRRGVMTKDLIDRVVLGVDDKAFWMTGEGRTLYNIIHDTREYFVAIASGLPPRAIPRSVVLPKSSTRVGRIADQSQLQQAISRAAAVENVALRILHDWVFKSGNRPRGYHVAFQYSLESFATDIARAMWYGEEWCDVVSPTVCAHTIDLSMDLPLWFAGANIEDRPDDDDMAAHQESTAVCIAHAFRAEVQMGALIDGEFISHDRLCREADCFRLLFAACMWIMRMAGDDLRSHYFLLREPRGEAHTRRVHASLLRSSTICRPRRENRHREAREGERYVRTVPRLCLSMGTQRHWFQARRENNGARGCEEARLVGFGPPR